MTFKRCWVLGASCLVLTALSVPASAQDSLSTVRELYASAAYEDALSALGKLPEKPRSVDEARTIEQYRAFCLLALGRSAEAEHAIETVVEGQPAYRPVDADMSPRVRAAFVDVRKRLLPTIIEQRYKDAKAAFDRREFSAASQGFQQVLDLMGDPDVAAAVGQPPLADMRVLARGFKDLSASAIPPPPLPSVPVAVARPQPAATAADPGATAPVGGPAATPARAPDVPRPAKIFASTDPRVAPPVTLHQELPAYPGIISVAKQGVIEVVIDEEGLVESAVMRAPVSPNYDALAIAATKTWRYKPAVANGVPVKYRKAVQITVKPRS